MAGANTLLFEVGTGAKGYDFSDEAIWMQDGRDEKTHDFSAYAHSVLKSKKVGILEVVLKSTRI